MVLVVGKVIGDTGLLTVQVGSTKLLFGDDLTRGCLHEGWTAQEDGRFVLNHDDLIGHCGDIRAASGAAAHDN